MKIVFFGSDDFAAVHLEALLSSTHQVVACITQPDRPQGRGMKMVVSPIKDIAMRANITCLQPDSFKDDQVIDALKQFNADIFVVVAYGRLLTQRVLDIPTLCCVNVHGSLLPAYRGAAPINWAIINGETVTGVTVQQMALALDAGDIIAQEQMPILPTTTAEQLRVDMAQVGAKALINTLDEMAKGTHQLKVQDESRVTYAPKMNKELSIINWHEAASIIDRRIRGLYPWPGSLTTVNDKKIKIHHAVIIEQSHQQPGMVLEVSAQGIAVACGQGALLLLTVQPEAGKKMSAYDYAQGYHISKGSIFI